MTYTNSSLIDYTKLSPNHSGKRTHSIDRITPHCVVGQFDVKGLADLFKNASRQASCNYGIAKDGKVALIVEEENRSWCTSSNANDQRAITIEISSEKTAPYEMNTVAYNKFIDLCVDICKRNGKKKLLWFGDKNKSLNYKPKSDEMILTVHRWFANKSCPGDWLYNRLDNVAKEVTERLGGKSTNVSTNTSSKETVSTSSTKKEEKKTCLGLGDKGTEVKELQKKLIACGYSCGSAGVDGDFGQDTLDALKKFQKAYNLVVDGLAGEKTLTKLDEVYKKKTTSSSTSKIKIDSASYFNKKYAKTYKTTANLNMRSGAGVAKKKVLTIPKGKEIKCFGYYSKSLGVVWLLVQYNGQTGFCSIKYLK